MTETAIFLDYTATPPTTQIDGVSCLSSTAGVHLSDQEHHEYRALERRFQAAAKAETLGQCAGHEVRRNEHGGTGLIWPPA